MESESARTLAGINILQGLDEAVLHRLESRCRWRRVTPGQRLIDFGAESREVFFIIDGAVSVVNFSANGREIAFATVEAGDLFGEISAIDGRPRSASVVAVAPSLIATLPAGTFVELLKTEAEVSFRLVERMTKLVRAGDIRIMELSTLAAAQRVYAELLRMAQPDAAVPGLWVVRPLPPLREIASRVSTTRETAARALSQVYSTGLMRRKGRNLYLMDKAKLEEFVSALQFAETGRAGG
ncbi:MAG: Crp/Fnr family transcriptional regulator [Rhodospirillales bacterium]|nr:Crp/Fnr family transcriptional regulator [Rhodospirillales bacterium]